MNENCKILAEAIAWLDEGHEVALATVVSTWGSSPRPTGSRLAVDEVGRFIGSVSGGCVEGAVLEAAEEVIQSGSPTLLEFGVSNEEAWKVGLACGGTVRIFVERLSDRDLFRTILDGIGSGNTAASITSLDSGLRGRFDLEGGLKEFELSADSSCAIQTARIAGEEAVVETPSGKFFLEFWRPPLRLAIIGAVHIAQGLAAIASAAGYEITIIDPRTAFATQQRFVGYALVTDWPDEALAKLDLNECSAVVALTHDPKIDDPALTAALRSPAFYIGALGSRKTAERRRERLRVLGFEDSELSRIKGPAGLRIGAVTPAEIAVSIVAEMTVVLRMDRIPSRGAVANEI